MQCSYCRGPLQLHRAAYRVDGGRILAIYCTAHCCERDGDSDLAAAFTSAPHGWAAINEHGNPCAPWDAPPNTLQDRLMAAFDMPPSAAGFLALLSDHPDALLQPGTILAAAQISATARGDRITLSSLLVDAFMRTSGSAIERACKSVASLVERAVPREPLGELDLQAACGWLQEHGVDVAPTSQSAQIVVLLHVTSDGDAWPVPSGAFRLAPHVSARRVIDPAPASAAALAVLLDELPCDARVRRYDPSARQRPPIRAEELRAIIHAESELPTLPSRVIPHVLSRVPAALEHPTLRARTPSVRGALALLGDVHDLAADPDPGATRQLAAILAEPYAVPFERRLSLVPTTAFACGELSRLVGLDRRGDMTIEPGEIKEVIAALVRVDDDAFVIITGHRIALVNGDSCSDIVGLMCCRDGAVWAACDAERKKAVRPIEDVRSTRVEPLIACDRLWFGRTAGGEIVSSAGPIPLGAILIDDAGRRIGLGLPPVVETAIAFACDVDPWCSEVVDRGPTPVQEPALVWGPVSVGSNDGACVVGGFSDEAPVRRLLIDDAPIEKDGHWTVLRREDDVVTIGQRTADILGVREIPISEATFRFRGSPQLGGELIALH